MQQLLSNMLVFWLFFHSAAFTCLLLFRDSVTVIFILVWAAFKTLRFVFRDLFKN